MLYFIYILCTYTHLYNIYTKYILYIYIYIYIYIYVYTLKITVFWNVKTKYKFTNTLQYLNFLLFYSYIYIYI